MRKKAAKKIKRYIEKVYAKDESEIKLKMLKAIKLEYLMTPKNKRKKYLDNLMA